jgi:hypothetical protein
VDEAGNYSQAYGEAGRGYRVLRDGRHTRPLPSPPSVNIRGVSQPYDGAYTNEPVAFALESVSVAPFLKFEIYLGESLVSVLSAGGGSVTVVPPAELGGAYEATAVFPLSRN